MPLVVVKVKVKFVQVKVELEHSLQISQQFESAKRELLDVNALALLID